MENDVILKNPVTRNVKYNIGKLPKKVRKTLQIILGYSNVRITMNLYVHVTEDEKLKEIEKIAAALKVI